LATFHCKSQTGFTRRETPIFIKEGVSKVDTNIKNASMAPNYKKKLILVKERRTFGH